MNKEECMLALEQIILELPQYRKITNELCNRYIPIYVKETYEEEQIYLEGNCGSSRDYCWDVYDTVPIEIVESILDYFKEQDDIKEENTNLKQALLDVKNKIEEMQIEFELKQYVDNFNERLEKELQIIDKCFEEGEWCCD